MRSKSCWLREASRVEICVLIVGGAILRSLATCAIEPALATNQKYCR